MTSKGLKCWQLLYLFTTVCFIIKFVISKIIHKQRVYGQCIRQTRQDRLPLVTCYVCCIMLVAVGPFRSFTPLFHTHLGRELIEINCSLYVFYHKTEREVRSLVKVCHSDRCLLRWISVRICSSLSRSVFVTASSGSPCLSACSLHGFRRKGASCNSRRRFFMRRCIWSDDKCLMNVEPDRGVEGTPSASFWSCATDCLQGLRKGTETSGGQSAI